MVFIDLPQAAYVTMELPYAFSASALSCQTPPTLTHLPFQSTSLRIEIVDAQARIRELGQMPENWDGYGALTISDETVKNALVALDGTLRWAPVPDVVPNPNGTLSFEWETDNGFAHLEIGKTRFGFYLKHRSDSPIQSGGSADQLPADLGELISALLYPVKNSAGTITKIMMDTDVRIAA